MRSTTACLIGENITTFSGAHNGAAVISSIDCSQRQWRAALNHRHRSDDLQQQTSQLKATIVAIEKCLDKLILRRQCSEPFKCELLFK
jgi:hypothetical protein